MSSGIALCVFASLGLSVFALVRRDRPALAMLAIWIALVPVVATLMNTVSLQQVPPVPFDDHMSWIGYHRERPVDAHAYAMHWLVRAMVWSAIAALVAMAAVTRSKRTRAHDVLLPLSIAASAALFIASLTIANKTPAMSASATSDTEAETELRGAIEKFDCHGESNGCARLEAALDAYWNADFFPPRAVRPIPPSLAAWRPLADRCAELVLTQFNRGWTANALQRSPLIHDEALHDRAMEWSPPDPTNRRHMMWVYCRGEGY